MQRCHPQSTTGEVWCTTILQQAVLNQLILDLTARAHLALWSVTAVEAHEGISQLVIVLALDVLIIDILRNRVVDVEQCNGIIRCTHTDVL